MGKKKDYPEDNQTFKLGDKREERVIYAKVRLVLPNNHIETKMTHVEKVYTSTTFSLLNIDGVNYPLEHPAGPDIWMTERRFTDQEAAAIPILIVYSIISTYLNIQDTFQTSTNFDLSEFFLTFALMGMGVLVALLMRNKQILVIELQKTKNAWFSDSIPDNKKPIIINRKIDGHHGYRFGHVFISFFAGAIVYVVLSVNTLDQVREQFPWIEVPAQQMGWIMISVYAGIIVVAHVGLVLTEKEYETQEREIFATALYYDPELDEFKIMEHYKSRFVNDLPFTALISAVTQADYQKISEAEEK